MTQNDAIPPLDDEIKAELHNLTFVDLIDWWEAIEHDYGDDGRRWLGRNDRYYLLTVLLDASYMWHPWIYERCREVEANPDGHLDLWAREHGKALALDTPVPTPFGWVNHGDLRVGDKVFSPSGEIRTVIATTEVFNNTKCFEIGFDGAQPIVCSDNHLWRVGKKSRKRISGTANKRHTRDYSIITAKELYEHDHKEDSRLSIQLAEPFDCNNADLPVNPYVLGAWLGDGSSSDSRITCAYSDHQIIENIMSTGISVHEVTSSNLNTGLYRMGCGIRGKKGTGLTSILRKLGVINNKHIPISYLRASKQQRIKLLQGLMDTDGTVNTRGTATFINTNEQLSKGVYELCCSLGLKPKYAIASAKLNGKVICPSYRVQFQPGADFPVFALERKQLRCNERISRSKSHFIRYVKQVESVPTSCIQVDHEDGMYVVGHDWVPTHNSTVITYAGIIQEILIDKEITIGIFSHTKPVAQKFLRQIKQELESNEELKRLYPDVLFDAPKKQSPKWSEDDGLIVKRNTNPKEPTLAASGLVDGMPTGAHFRLRVYDDVVTKESVNTPEQIKKTTEAWSLSDNLGAVTKLPDGKEIMRTWHIGTRYSFADTYQHILDNKILIPRVYPATDDGTMHGNPVYLSDDIWQHKLKTQLESDIACQQLQNPVAGSQAMFKKEFLRFLDIRPGTLNAYLMVDPASSKKKGSDRTAMAVVGMDANRNKYLLDGFCHRMNLRERWENMYLLRKKWINAFGIQSLTVGYERYGMQSDIEYFEEQMKVAKDSFDIVELNWVRDGEQSKVDRIQRLYPDMKQGKFFLPAILTEPSEAQKRVIKAGEPYRVFTPTKRKDEKGNIYHLNKIFLEEYLVYPFASHDDFLDAVSRMYDMDMVPPQIIDMRALQQPDTVD